MNHQVKCHSDGLLLFPKECVCCGNEPKAIHTVRAFRAIDLIIFAIGECTLITVPLCRRCYFLRSFFGPLVGMVAVMASIGIPFILSVGTLDPIMNQVWMWVAVIAMPRSFLYYRNWNDAIMDRLLSGIAAGKLQKDRTFSLWLRREELIPQLSYSLQPRRYVDTASYATYEQRGQQQLNSWWAKCLFGLFFIAGAGMCLFALTHFEAGNRQFGLPNWVMAIYGVIGKWPTCLLFALPGVFAIGWGGYQLATEKRGAEIV